MEHIRNWSQNSLPNKYEQELSPFGRKVMAALFKLKDENKSTKRFYSVPQNRYENKKVIQFNNQSPPNSHLCYEQTTNVNICDMDNTNFNINKSPLLSTSLNLIDSPKNDNNLKDVNIKLNLNEKNNSCFDSAIFHSADSNTNNKESNDNLINWGFHQMFDINDIFDCVDDNNIDKSIETHLCSEFKINNVALENKVNIGHNINSNAKEENNPKESVKRKNIKNDQGLKEKKSKINDTMNEKKSYRKQKYTTTINKWLNNVHPTNKNRSDQNDEEISRTIINACPNSVQKNKKEIQAQLTNKDGKMKYAKPIDFETNKIFDKNKIELKSGITESTVNKKTSMDKVVKQKKVRSKFIVPIKSQIPVKDIEYPIKIINDINIKELEGKLNAIKNEEIVIILVFSNGFCQLNNQHTDDTCIPEAIFLNVYDTFYYLKSMEACLMNTFCRLISSNTLICYDAKKILLYLNSYLEEALELSVIFDVKIGGSLISPDEPPETFADLQKLLLITTEYTISTECMLQKTAWYTTLLKESANKLRSMMEDNGVFSLFINIEMKILPIIAGMERRGICVNMTKLKSMEGILMTRMKEVEAECHKAAGKPFQINSTLQVRTILYDDLQLDLKCNVKIRETVSKRAKSTSETMLQSLSSVHPLPRLILEYRHLHKAYATFVAGIAQHVVDGVVKPTWDQTAAVTGRIASNNPNLQAIPRAPFSLVPFPKEGETEPVALRFRSLYTSRAGHCLLAADFKHVECRVLAAAAGDHALQHALQAQDLFRELAKQWLCKSEASVSSEDRALTKRLVYASVYGAGARTLGHVLRATGQRLGDVIDSFNKTFPSLKSFSKSVVSECQSRGGRLTTPSGRTRIFKNIFSTDFTLRSQAERRAVNFIIQGTAADLCKRAMVLAQSAVRSQARLLLQLHDELVWEVPHCRLHGAAAIIKSAMESCGGEFGLELVLPVSMYCGNDWGEMEEFIPCVD